MPLQITIDSRIRFRAADCPPATLAMLRAAFTHENPEYKKKKALKFFVNPKDEFITTWRSHMPKVASPAKANPVDEVVSFPRGGFDRVSARLTDDGVFFQLIDKRTTGQRTPGDVFRAMCRPLMDHQTQIVDVIKERETALIRAGTGSGKTTAMIALIADLKLTALVVVHSAALAAQWVKQIEINLGIPASEVGFIGSGRFSLKPITIAIQRSLSMIQEEAGTKAKTLNSFFGVVVADECQFFGATTFIQVIDPMSAKYRVGCSADHRRKDRKDFLIEDLFGTKSFEINHADLVLDQIVQPVEIRILESATEADWYKKGWDYEKNRRASFTDLVKVLAADDERETLYIQHVVAEVQGGARCFVLAHEREHCQAIVAKLAAFGIKAGLLLGGPASKPEFDATLAKINAGELQVGVGTYPALGTGIDAPSVSVGFAVTPIGNHEQLLGQVRGRFCRKFPGRDHGRLYMVLDPKIYDDKHHKNIKRWNDRNVVYRNDTWQKL